MGMPAMVTIPPEGGVPSEFLTLTTRSVASNESGEMDDKNIIAAAVNMAATVTPAAGDFSFVIPISDINFLTIKIILRKL
jgi:hypothetical protein